MTRHLHCPACPNEGSLCGDTTARPDDEPDTVPTCEACIVLAHTTTRCPMCGEED